MSGGLTFFCRKKVPMPRRYDETMSTLKKQRINPTAAPVAMKGSAKAGSVIGAPVKVEQRLLKVCVLRTPLERAWRRIKIVLHLHNRLARHCTGRWR